jgi:hypothetical protein
MSYRLGIQVDEGLVSTSDSRTNSGIDSVSTFRKVFIFEQPGERVIVPLTAGNRAITQERIGMVERGLGTDDPERSLFHIESMLFAAKIGGGPYRPVPRRYRLRRKGGGDPGRRCHCRRHPGLEPVPKPDAGEVLRSGTPGAWRGHGGRSRASRRKENFPHSILSGCR